MSDNELCLLCVDNLALNIELNLDKFKPTTELLQQLFAVYNINVEVGRLCESICEPCMGEVLHMCDTLRCWQIAQQKLKEHAQTKADEMPENGMPDQEVDVEDLEMELELMNTGYTESDADTDYETLDAQLSAELNEPPEDQQLETTRFSIAIAPDGVVLGKVIRHDSMSPKLACYYCDQEFRGAQRLQRHSELSHVQRYYVCRQCSQSYDSLAQLQRHEQRKQHQQEAQKSVEYRCQDCGRLFDRFFCLVRHENDVHRGITSEFICSFCGQSFKYKNSYQRHLSKHEGKEDLLRIHACSFGTCKSRFFRSYQLKMHQRIHTALQKTQTTKVLTCDICGKSYANKSNLSYHRRTIHLGERRFPCDICQRTFNTTSRLNKHKLNHAQDDSEKDDR